MKRRENSPTVREDQKEYQMTDKEELEEVPERRERSDWNLQEMERRFKGFLYCG